MKSFLLSTLALVTAALVPEIHAARSGPIDATIVAEQTTAASSGSPGGTYLVYDAGYFEGGDPVAGETPPTADAVHAQLSTALAAAGFSPAPAGAHPDFLVVYHWGVLRLDTHRRPRSLHIHPNLRARLALVATDRVVRKAEDYYSAPRPPFLPPDLRDALELAADDRYAVIVSAYRYDDLAHSQPTLLWHTALSALTNSGRMSEVINSLAHAAGPYLGRRFPQPPHPSMPFAASSTSSSASRSDFLPAESVTPFLRDFVKRQREEISGLRDADSERRPDFR